MRGDDIDETKFISKVSFKLLIFSRSSTFFNKIVSTTFISEKHRETNKLNLVTNSSILPARQINHCGILVNMPP